MVETRKYAMVIQVKTPFEETKLKVVEALAVEGFGVLTEIDVAATLKKKLGVDFRPYAILGACNPPLAHRALEEEADLGLLLPCNLVVYAVKEGGCTVAAIDPVVQFSKVQNPRLEPIALEVRHRLERVLEGLRGI